MKLNYLIQDLKKITSGDIINKGNDNIIEAIILDSRFSYSNPESTLFIAIDGINHDGHIFIKTLYDKGVRNFIIEKEIDFSRFQGANILKVPKAKKALQQIAKNHLFDNNLTRIGITGSVGKTIVKEWLYQVLNQFHSTIRSPKSYNSQTGLPLSVLEVTSEHNLGIFEVGISHPKEMQNLAHVLDPQFGIFTKVSSAHLQNFKSQEELVKEKSILFENANWVVCPNDPLIVNTLKNNSKATLVTVGESADATIQILQIDKNLESTFIELKFDEIYSFKIPFIDDISIYNAILVATYCIYLKLDWESISRSLANLSPIKLRLERIKGINDCLLINDVFGSDLASLKIALQFAKEQPKKRLVLILSDLEIFHDTSIKELNEILSIYKIEEFIGIGDEIYKNRNVILSNGVTCYKNTNDFLVHFKRQEFSDAVVVIKGSRKFEFERITALFEIKNHQTRLEINLSAIEHNLSYFRALINKKTKMMVMIKASAYGSGSLELSYLLKKNGVDYLGVAFINEGIELRDKGVDLPIMIMNPNIENLNLLYRYDLEPEIYSLRLLKQLIEISNKEQKHINIHVKLDTGMNRLGFVSDDLLELIKLLKSSKYIKVVSVLSHLAAADEEKYDEFTLQQINTFEKYSRLIQEELNDSFDRHILNSAGIQRFPQYQYSMVRLGLGLYGIGLSEHNHQLEEVISLKSSVSQIKHISENETIGYSRKGKVDRPTRIATIPIGYADGIPRKLSNGVGKVKINNYLVPIIGNICMDMLMVDIGDLDIVEGDEVTFFGSSFPINHIATNADTIPYEILTSISSRINRVFYRE